MLTVVEKCWLLAKSTQLKLVKTVELPARIVTIRV